MDIPQIAARQGGVFTVSQALAEGWSTLQIRGRRRSGKWVRVAGAGLAEPGATWTAFQLAMAARLTWPECVTSHQTAAALHRFPLPVALPVHVTTSRGRRSGRGLRGHALRLPDEEVMELSGGVRLTTPTRTALDCLASLDTEAGLELLAWLVTRQVMDHETLIDAVRERRHWHGTPRLVALARLTRTGAVSGGEFKLHRLLREAGIRGWQANVAVSDAAGIIGVVDILFAGRRVVIELDGWRAHSSRASFVNDRRRQNRLEIAGYKVLRFTMDDLTVRPKSVIAEIKAVIS